MIQEWLHLLRVLPLTYNKMRDQSKQSLKMNQFTFGCVKITETVLMMNYQNNQLDAATAEKKQKHNSFQVYCWKVRKSRQINVI